MKMALFYEIEEDLNHCFYDVKFVALGGFWAKVLDFVYKGIENVTNDYI